MMRLALLLFLIGVVLAIPITECTEISQPGTYTLENDLSGAAPDQDACIYISSSDVTLDCAGHVLDGSNSQASFGIKAEKVEDVKITNCEVRNYPSHGIIITSSTRITLTSNKVFDSGFSTSGSGIWTSQVSDSTIKFNKANRNSYGFTFQQSNNNLIEDNVACGNEKLDFIVTTSSSGNTGSVMADKTNIVGNNQIEVSECSKTIDSCTTIDAPGDYVLTKDISGAIPWQETSRGTQKACIVIDANDVSLDCRGNSINYYGTESLVSGIVTTIGRSNVEIRNCGIDGFTEEGIGLYLSNDILVENNIISNVRKQGIDASIDNSIIRYNTVENSQSIGIGFAGSSNTVKDNTISNTPTGIVLYGGNVYKEEDNNLIQNNKISFADVGIYLRGDDSNVETGNTIKGNTIEDSQTAIKAEHADNNFFEENQFYSTSIGMEFISSSSNQVNNNVGCLDAIKQSNPSYRFDADSGSNRGIGNTGSKEDDGGNSNFNSEKCDFFCSQTPLEVLAQDYIPVKVVAEDPNANLLKLEVFLFNNIPELIASKSTSSPDPVASLELETTFENLAPGAYVVNATAEDEAGSVGKAANLLFYLAGSTCPSDSELDALCKDLFPSASYDPETGECSNPDGGACFSFNLDKCNYGIYFVDPTPTDGAVLPPGKVIIRAKVHDYVADIRQAELGYVGPAGSFSKLFYPNSQEQTIEVEVDLQKEGEYLLQGSFVDEEGNYGLVKRSISVSADGSTDFGTLSLSHDILCPSGAYLLTVSDEDGGPVEGATITAINGLGEVKGEETTNENGKATLSLISDTYTITVGAEGFNLHEEQLEVPALADRCPEGGTEGETPGEDGAGHSITLGFVDPTPNEPIPPGEVTIAARATDPLGDLESLSVAVFADESEVSSQTFESSGDVSEGSLALELQEGAYIAKATAQDASGLVEERSRGIIVDSSLGQEGPALDVSFDNLDCNAGFVEFLVSSDGQPVEGVTVFIDDGEQTETLTTDEEGKAGTSFLPDQSYDIRAWKKGYALATTSFSAPEACTQQFLDSLNLLYSLTCVLNNDQIDTQASVYSDSETEVNAEVTSPAQQVFSGKVSSQQRLFFPVDVSGDYLARVFLGDLSSEKTLSILTCDDAATFCIQQTLEDVCAENPTDSFCSYLNNEDCLNAESPFLCAIQGYSENCAGNAESDSCNSFKQCLAEKGIDLDGDGFQGDIREREPSITENITQNPQICAALILLALGAGFWFYKKYYA